MAKIKVEYIRIPKSAQNPPAHDGWKLVKELRKSKLYARIINVENTAMNVNTTATRPTATRHPAPPKPALNDKSLDDLAELFGNAFQLGAQEVQNTQQATLVVQAVLMGVQAEEDAIDAQLAIAMSGIGIKGGKMRSKSRKNKVKPKK